MRRFSLGRVLGIPILLDTSWFVILALVTWTLATGYFTLRITGASPLTYGMLGLGAAVLLFLCVLLHELGHAAAAKAYGIPVSRVTLFIFGGVAHIAQDPRRPLVELSVALAGPLVSVGIAALCFWSSAAMAPALALHPAYSPDPAQMVLVTLRYLAVVNSAILAFNLLPGFPLDGGRLLRAVLWAWLGDLRRATRIASALGSGLGIGLMVLGALSLVRGQWINGIWYGLLGMFLRNAARASYEQVGG